MGKGGAQVTQKTVMPAEAGIQALNGIARLRAMT
jgi:hypothetical protein